jgi:hypothetical protein
MGHDAILYKGSICSGFLEDTYEQRFLQRITDIITDIAWSD